MASSGRVLGLPIRRLLRQFAVGRRVVYYNRRGFREQQPFHMFDLAAKKETPLGNVSAYDIAADGKKMIVMPRTASTASSTCRRARSRHRAART